MLELPESFISFYAPSVLYQKKKKIKSNVSLFFKGNMFKYLFIKQIHWKQIAEFKDI